MSERFRSLRPRDLVSARRAKKAAARLLRQRHSRRHLFWRGVVASFGNLGMATGLYPLVPHAGMVLARARKGSANPPGQLRIAAAEWAVALTMSVARPIGFLGLPVRLRAAQGPRPIIVVHGYAMNRANFLPLARRLGAAGLGPVLGFEYWTLGKTSSAARRLGAYVDRVLEATGAPAVDLIGHSMGGVVSRYYVSLGGGSSKVKNLITLGSPHRGTDVSAFGLGRPVKELFPGSSLMQRLEAATPPPDTRITAIWSRSDALVAGSRHARIRGVDEIIYEDLGHLSLLVSRRVANDIIERLREE